MAAKRHIARWTPGARRGRVRPATPRRPRAPPPRQSEALGTLGGYRRGKGYGRAACLPERYAAWKATLQEGTDT